MLLLIALLVFASDAALAQITLNSGSSGGAPLIVDEGAARTNANTAFNTEVSSTLATASVPTALEDSAQQFGETLRKDFRAAVDKALTELKGDGVLGAREVSDELRNLRDEYINRLTIAIDAFESGHQPPPERKPGQSWFDHAVELSGYTFVTRSSPADWGKLLAAVAVGLLLAWSVNTGLRRLADGLRNRHRSRTARFLETLTGPLYLAILVLALNAGFDWIWIPGIANEFLQKAVHLSLAGALFWFLSNACNSLAEGVAWILRKTYRANTDQHVVTIVSRVLRVLLVVIFAVILIRSLLDSNLTAFIAGLGIIGVALSFILRGTIENIAASFTIFGDQPFRVGDLVVFEDQLGKIDDIGFRSTRFQTLDGHMFTIPNSKLIDDAIRNVSTRPTIRRRFRLGLTYDTPPDKVEEAISIVEEILQQNDAQPDGKPCEVHFAEFGDYALTLLIEYHFAPADYWKALAHDSSINLEILRRFNEAGIELAFPTQSIYLKRPDAEREDDAGHRTDDEMATPADGRTEADAPGEQDEAAE